MKWACCALGATNIVYPKFCFVSTEIFAPPRRKSGFFSPFPVFVPQKPGRRYARGRAPHSLPLRNISHASAMESPPPSRIRNDTCPISAGTATNSTHITASGAAASRGLFEKYLNASAPNSAGMTVSNAG